MLLPDEPPAFEVVNPHGASRALVLCDHASPLMPRALGTLGLDPSQLLEHIGYDIGAAHIARRLSALLDAPLVLSGYSRLAIDCNRPLAAPSSIPAVTCGVRVPGNEGLSQAQRDARAEACFWPYHRAIEALLDARPRPRAVLSVHTFTPDMPGEDRPWPIAMLWGKDRTLAGLFIDELRARHGLLVGDNQPYRITDGGDYSVPAYAERRGVPGVLIEVRQDGARTAQDAHLWAERLAEIYLAIEPRLGA